MKQPKASLIIRTKNEEKWIHACLQAVFNQDFKDFEVIIVDDHSTDHTLDRVAAFPVKLVHYEGDYLPGRCLNYGIRAAKGEFLVMISGHCVPVDSSWLRNLLAGFGDESVAGVYGRQEPLPYSSDWDKRDLLTIFGLDRKVQRKDSFFHNANSAIRRSLWELFPFDETATNIEDRLWAKKIISEGYTLVYEPEASVYHWHGIHQDRLEERCTNVVRILESLDLAPRRDWTARAGESVKACAIIPVHGESPILGNRSLLSYTIESALESKRLSRVIVSTDSEKTAELAKSLGAEVPFLRPPHLAKDYIGLDEVLYFSLQELEKSGFSPDLVVMLKETYPFRPVGLVDALIQAMLAREVDTLIPVASEYRSCFRHEEGALRLVYEGFIPRKVKDPLFLSSAGLGMVISSATLKSRMLVGQKLDVYPMPERLNHIEVDRNLDAKVAAKMLEEYWTRRAESI